MSFLSDTLVGWRQIDDFVAADNGITRLDARAKILSALCVLIAVAGSHRYAVTALLPLFAYPLVLLIGGGIPLMWLLKRVAVVLPFAILIGLLNPWLDNTVWVTPWEATVSAGWLSFISIILRAILTAAIALLLLATTGMVGLSVGLRQLGVPAVLTTQLMMLYRYFFVIGEQLNRMHQAYRLRNLSDKRMPLSLAKRLLIVLFDRSMSRSVRVYQAMLLRGFDGTFSLSQPPRWQRRDSYWLIAWLIVAVSCYFIDIPQLMGGLLMSIISEVL